MDRFEMIEKLRERADISYEEARDVLDRANSDLLEAIVLLEKEGKIRQPQESAAASEVTGKNNNSRESRKGSFGKAFHRAGSFLAHTAFHLSCDGKELLVMPSWTFALLLLFFWEILVPVMLIALFFNVRYSFDGSGQAQAINDLCSKAGSFADGFESSLHQEM